MFFDEIFHGKCYAAHANAFGEEALSVTPIDCLAIYRQDTSLPDRVKCDLLPKTDGHLFPLAKGTHVEVELEAVPIASLPRLGVLLVDRHARPV